MLLPNLQGKQIILASQSPRRQALLEGLELKFEVRVKDIDETYPDTLKREDVALYLANLKADAHMSTLNEDEILITSDTIVCLDGDILNKPLDRSDAIGMLHRLSGATHTVVTAVAIRSKAKSELFHDETEVTFCSLSDDEIIHYVDKYEPFDKAGAYGAQDLLGYIAIEKMVGSYYTVMGFPLHKVYNSLKNF
jgi:septum formation protein